MNRKIIGTGLVIFPWVVMFVGGVSYAVWMKGPEILAFYAIMLVTGAFMVAGYYVGRS